MNKNDLVQRFGEYSSWRDGIISALERYRACVDIAGLSDAASDQCFARTIARLAGDKLSLAFVAEFSRGKSELINAIFFAEYGQRILPSSAGRTTMCPTELMYNESRPPSIRLLPIETRAQSRSITEYKEKEQDDAWTVLPLDIESGEGMLKAFQQVSITKRVPIAEAKQYGLYDESDPNIELAIDQDGWVEISQWRHAIVNFPHPLLRQGLIIIDTPGLNAIGTEPELTLNLIPNAHAVLFILAADTGVTRSDIEVWRDHIGGGPGRMVVLNKIDSMWDELRTPDEIETQIGRQVSNATQMLGVAATQVFPVSAQKGLIGKINQDAGLLAKSRLPALETALSNDLIPAKLDMMRAQLMPDIEESMASKQALLAARARNVIEQLVELRSLQGKNRNIVKHMMMRIEMEKKEFDDSLFKLQATRAVFARLSTEVYTRLGMGMLKDEIRKTRDTMNDSKFSIGLRQAVTYFFEQIHANLAASGQKIEEIFEMMAVMYRKFSTEHGLALSSPMPFSLGKYEQEIKMIQGIYQKQFSTAAILTTPQVVIMQRFFDSIASRVKQCFLQANRDVESWLKVVMSPLEAQIGEHKAQLKRRKVSIERIHSATDSLEEKVQTFEKMQVELEAQKRMLIQLETELKAAISAELVSFSFSFAFSSEAVAC